VSFPSAGAATVLGNRLGRTDLARLRARIGHVDVRDAARFAPNLTVEQVVATGATGTIGLFPERLVPADIERAGELVGVFGLGRLRRRLLGELSQGERARTLIARALVARPDLLLLDEPAAGVDLPGRETLVDALDRAGAADPRLALLLATHHLEELPAGTTHALLLRDGRAVAAGAIEETLTAQNLSACFGLPLSVGRSGGRWHVRSDRAPWAILDTRSVSL
jgi:iron complex transport system ATP-binding protein